ncbi:MAG: NAD-dependent epimerase/dehydratase family protein, partial [Candidatus Moduliflexus flocculans]|nr:NAD-dependent epimerase/dehydratase family protein [Candidatus Moduliflexus flocculans]
RWYQRMPGVECLCLDVSRRDNCERGLRGRRRGLQPGGRHGRHGLHRALPRRVPALASSINTHMIEAAYRAGAERYFFSSSACAYNIDLQKDARRRGPSRSPTPTRPMAERGYGWEKLISRDVLPGVLGRARPQDGHRPLPQRLRPATAPGTAAARRRPAAICAQGHRGQGHRQLRRSRSGATGTQTRSFMYIDDCVDGHRHDHALRRARSPRPSTWARSELVSINELVAHHRGDRRRQARAHATT